MKKFMTIAGAALLATSVAGSAFAQANPSAPQPNSTGTGTYQPGTATNGQAVDSKQTGTTGSSMSKESKSMDNGMKKEKTEK
jgi:opacity protein-like surface antigen